MELDGGARACPLPPPPQLQLLDATAAAASVLPVLVRQASHGEARAITRYLDWHLARHPDLSFGYNQDQVMAAAAARTLWVVRATPAAALAGFMVTQPPRTLVMVEVCEPWRRRGIGAAAVRAWEGALRAADAATNASAPPTIAVADTVLPSAEPFWRALGYTPAHADGRARDTWLRAVADAPAEPAQAALPRHVGGYTLRPQRLLLHCAAAPPRPQATPCSRVAAALFADGDARPFWTGTAQATLSGRVLPPLLAMTRLTGVLLVVAEDGCVVYAGRPHGEGAGTTAVHVGTRDARALTLHHVRGQPRRARRAPFPPLPPAATAWLATLEGTPT